MIVKRVDVNFNVKSLNSDKKNTKNNYSNPLNKYKSGEFKLSAASILASQNKAFVNFKGKNQDYIFDSKTVTDDEYKKTYDYVVNIVDNDDSVYDIYKTLFKNSLNKLNIKIAKALIDDNEISMDDTIDTIKNLGSSKEKLGFFKRIYNDKDIPKETYSLLLSEIDKPGSVAARAEMYDFLKNNKNIPPKDFWRPLSLITTENKKLAEALYKDNQYDEYFADVLYSVNKDNIDLVTQMFKDKKVSGIYLHFAVTNIKKGNVEVQKRLYEFLKDLKELPENIFADIMAYTPAEDVDFIKTLLKKDNLSYSAVDNIINFERNTPENISPKKDIFYLFCDDKNLAEYDFEKLLVSTKKDNLDTKKNLYGYFLENTNLAKAQFASAVASVEPWNIEAKKTMFQFLKQDKYFSDETIAGIVSKTDEKNLELKKELYARLKDDKYFDTEIIAFLLENINNLDELECIYNFDEREIRDFKNIALSLYKNNKKGGFSVKTILDLYEFRNVKSLDDCSFDEKRSFLKKVIKNNVFLYNQGLKNSGYFTIVPDNRTEYLEFVKKAMQSMGYEIAPLDEKQKLSFYNALSSFNNKNDLSEILEAFPELKNSIDETKWAHKLDIINSIENNNDYKSLSDNERKLLKISLLFDDIAKDESAYDTFYILQKLDMPEEDRNKIYKLIKNQNWFDNIHKYNGLKGKQNSLAKMTALEFSDKNLFKIEKLLTDAKLQNKNLADIDLCKQDFQFACDCVEKYINELQNTKIILPQSKIPKASELVKDNKLVKDVETKDKNGNIIKNRVVYLKKGLPLDAYGFEKGLKSDDLNVIVHALDYEEQFVAIPVLSDIDSDAILSTSYVNYGKDNYHVFRNQGLVLYAPSNNILAGTYKDFGSGYQKNLEEVKDEYFFGAPKEVIRNYMSEMIKNKFNVNGKDYIDLCNLIENKSIPEIEQVSQNTAQAFREIIQDMEVQKRSYNRNYNEWLVTKPRVQAIFYQGRKSFRSASEIEEIPDFLRLYAQDNDLPIIYFGE